MAYNTIKLMDIIAKLETGGRPKGGAQSEGIPSLGAEHLNGEGSLNLEKLKFIPEDYFNNLRQGKIEIDDVLIVKDGATTGKVAFVNSDFPYEEAAINEHVFKIKVKKEIALPKYIFYYVYSKRGQSEVLKDFRGATVGGISKSFTEKVLVPLPPIETQKKIANVLDKAQELIDKRKEQIEKLDDFLQSVFLDMFGDPVTNSKGLEVTKVVNVCQKILGGGTPSKNVKEYYYGNIPWVTPKDMKSLYIFDSIDHITEDAVKNSSTKIVPKNSLLMVIRSGILKRYLPVAINKKVVTVNQDMKAFVINNSQITVEFLLYFFLTVQRTLLTRVRSVTADNIEFNLIKELHIPIPPLDLQNKFAEIVEKVEAQKELMQKSLTEMENNFNSIMQKAFKGELF